MKVFLAGASGAIGIPIIQNLVKQGHQVVALTQSSNKTSFLSGFGADPVVANILDYETILDAIQNSKPDAIINMLTALPKEYTPKDMEEAGKKDKKIRIEGGENLLKAAKVCKIKRHLVQSTGFWYAPGAGLADEKESLAFEATPGIAAGCRLYQKIENRLLEDSEFEGIVLRFGFFYGPRTWYERGESMAEQVRKREYPLVEHAEGLWNFIHIEDAAEATVSALKAPSGIYNIVDNQPISMFKWVKAYARWLEAPDPIIMTKDEYMQSRGEDAYYYATQLRGASNAKAKTLLGLKPRMLEWV